MKVQKLLSDGLYKLVYIVKSVLWYDMETKIFVTSFIYDPRTKKALVCKRSEDEDFFPGVYEMPGGKLD